MTLQAITFFSAFLLGLAGSTHCLGMCGGISSALGSALPKPIQWQFAYQSGRVTSYMLVGAFAGGLGFMLVKLLGDNGVFFLRVLTGFLFIVIGLYLLNIWRGITWFERLGQKLWRFIAPLSKKMLPITSLPRAMVLGMMWGFLPCGLVYTTVALAMTENHWYTGSFIMLGFGLGTLPAMLSVGFTSAILSRYLKMLKFQIVSGLLMLTFGLWTIAFQVVNRILATSCHHG